LNASTGGRRGGAQGGGAASARIAAKQMRFDNAIVEALKAPNTLVAARKQHEASMSPHRLGFTVSATAPGALSNSYFAVACTNRNVYIISMATGREELALPTRAPVYAIAAGRSSLLVYGDTYGNLYKTVCKG
jgi:murein DD-endopeptidase MepM/ murein hydrolase activator NlpD